MLLVFSVILEYCIDGRNFSERSTLRPHVVVLYVHSALSPFKGG